ncbi:helix-turn-helix domain-containing protein [Nocardioides zeae]|uniref:Helix-turn-helix domain-containing protein n=1 Tax=Nocardioides imazamoxiresistens TaxID=3231893 RepID=A0ABU3PUR0_9ACTN|nr:RodZ domain-containing protein [Nocardioides zeae]MDT9592587.1 helix-turn-helix domain-containing protein [Nocardioides zeae]
MSTSPNPFHGHDGRDPAVLPDRPDSAARRDPFGLGLPRRPDWESFGVLTLVDDPASAPRPDDVVEVRRSGLVTGLVGVAAAGLGLAWLGRALGDGGVLSWSVTGLLAIVALAHLTAFVDARVPVAVLDAQGVRMRLGRTWQGLPWESVDHVTHAPRTSRWRDGRLLVEPFESDEVVAALDRGARWHAWWARRWYGGAFALPLGVSTRVVGADDLGATLERVVDPAVDVVTVLPPVEPETQAQDEVRTETEPETEASAEVPTEPASEDRTADPTEPKGEEAPTRAAALSAAAERVGDRARRVGPWAAGLLARVGERRAEREQDEQDEQDEPVVAGTDDAGVEARATDDAAPATPVGPAAPVASPVSPLRETRRAVRAEVVRDEPSAPVLPAAPAAPLPEAAALQRPTDPGLAAYERDEPVVDVVPMVESDPEPVREPVVGPVFTAARRRLGLSVDQLAERTRIRPHVIEAIEVDDFGPCGGDFYARGHLRTLARILGVDGAEAVARFDAEYADAPIDARRVFEAELATVPGGSMRATRGGPNWSVLVAAVMSLILLWSAAQMLFSGSDEETAAGGAAGLSSSTTSVEPVGVVLTAPDAAVALTVRDGEGEVVWQGELAAGQSQSVDAVPPVRVSSSDGAVTAAVDGGAASELGQAGSAVQRSLSP